MSGLPCVAVIGSGPSSVIALTALVDGGLDTQGVCTDDLGPDAVDVLSRHGLTGRLRRVDAAVGVTGLGGEGGRGPFEIVAGGEVLGRFDAVVVTDADRFGAPLISATSGAEGMDGRACRFGGVFDPDFDSVGVYLVGRVDVADRAGPAGSGPAAVRELVWAQARWVGEYLRGRYLLPPRPVMLGHPTLPAPRRLGRQRPGVPGYLVRLDRELRRGRARAASAGYPLPLRA